MAIITGNGGNDNLVGTGSGDLIFGLDGNDILQGGAGNDTIYGGTGNDWIDGGTGNDYISGGDNDDQIYGGTGNDWINGGKGNDTIYGGTGNDTIYGDNWYDLFGWFRDGEPGGNDYIEGGIGNDRIFGGRGNDEIHGGDGNDKIYGDNWFDWFDWHYDGQAGGNDTIYGGAGNDTIFGGDGNDTLIGGSGVDKLSGGDGHDAFVYLDASDSPASDVILDFVQGEDTIDFDALREPEDLVWNADNGALAFGVWFAIAGDHTVIFADTTGEGIADLTIELNGIFDLTPDDFTGVAAVTGVNEAPSVALENTVISTPENGAAVKVADIVVTDDALGTNVLSLSGTDAAAFSILGGNELWFAGGADFETLASYDVTVDVNDAGVVGSPDDSASLTLAITDVNEAPSVALENTVISTPENGAAVKVADIVVTDDALGTNVLSLSGTDAAAFSILGGNELWFAGGADFETLASYDVTVDVNDAGVVGSPDDSASLTLAITDVNEAPSVALENTVISTPENGAAVKVADIVVTDDALGTNVLSLSGTDAAAFSILGGNELWFAGGADFETLASYDVTVDVNDAGVVGSPDDSASLTLAITDVNEAPSVALENTVISTPENGAAVKVADIVVTDDALGTNVLSLSGTDAAAFSILGGNELWFAGGADFETLASYDVTVDVNDAGVVGSPDDSASLTLAITDVNEAPSVALENTVISTPENGAAVKVADIVVTDDALGTNVLSLSGTDAAAFSILGGNELWFAGGADFETLASYDVTVDVNDAGVVGSPDDSASLTLAITDVNEAPSVALENTVISTPENGAAVKVADIVVTDDALGTNVLSLSGTDAAAFSILGGNELWFAGGADFETLASYDVTVDVNDAGVVGSPDDSASLTLAITDVNEAPSVALENTVISTPENGAAVKVADIVVTDDALGTNVLSLSGTDAAAFSILGGNELWFAGGADFETLASYDVTVDVNDAGVVGSPDDSASLTLAITDVNEAPSVALENTVISTPENGAAVKVADIVVTDDALGTNVLSLSGTDAAAFSILGGNELWFAGGADFETLASYDVTVDVNDAGVVGSPDDSASLTLAITDVNEAPSVALENTVISTPENGAAVKVADIVVTDDALGTNVLSLSGTDAAAFSILGGNELWFAGGADFETLASYDVTVDVNDAGVVGSPDDSASLTLAITDVNEAPSVALENTVISTPENGAAVKVADIVVTDDALGTNVLSLSGTDAAAFSILGGNELWFAGGADFETLASYDVTVDVNDAGVVGSPDDSASLTLAITDVNEAPSVALENTVISTPENGAAVKVADIVVTDDALGTNVLSLSGTDAAAFSILGGNELWFAGGADFETLASYDVTVDVNDAGVVGSPDDSASLTLAITDVNEAPSVALENTVISTPENGAAVKVADIVVTDDALGTNVLSLSGTDAAAFSILGGNELWFAGGADFETLASYDVTVDVNDAGVVGSPDDSASLTLAITDVNEAPSVALENTVISTPENGAAVKVADIVVTDDALGTNVLSLSGTDAAAFSILGGNELWFAGGADFETLASYDVTVDVNDAGVVGSPDDSASLTLAITDVNEAPSVALENTVISTPENGAAVKVADIVVTDDALGTNVLSLSGTDAAAFSILGGNELWFAGGADFETLASYDVTVDVNDAGVVGSPDDSASLTLAITDVNEAPSVALENTVISTPENGAAVKVADIVVTDDALGTNVLSLSGTDAAAFSILGGNELWFAGGADFETLASYDVTVDVNDAGVVGSPDDSASLTLAITDVNEAPEGANATVVTDEDTAHVFTAADFGFTDVEDTDLTAVKITTLPLDGTLKLSGTAIAANDEISFASIDAGNLTFEPADNQNGEDYASFHFLVRDSGGAYDDDANTITIDVTAVNDAPAAVDETLSSVAEDSGMRTISFALLLTSDGDGDPEETQTLTITAVTNVIGGTALINGTDIEFTPTLNFNGTASFDYTVQDNGQTNGSDDFKTDTGHASFTVTAVNDAPTVAGVVVTVTSISFVANDPDNAMLSLVNSPVAFATAFGNPTITSGATTNLTPNAQGSALTGTLQVTDGAAPANVVGLYLGTNGNDIATGPLASAPNAMYGFDGTDSLTGGTGADSLYGGAGTDTLRGGSLGEDTLTGGVGDDTLFGGAGADTYIFGLTDGTDTITESGGIALEVDAIVIQSDGTALSSLNFEKTAIDVDLAINDLVIQYHGQQISVKDHLLGGSVAVESLMFYGGASFAGYALGTANYLLDTNFTGDVSNDVLAGTGSGETLDGGDGNDLLFGNGGDDSLTGGAGKDLLVGGAGNDTFDYNAVSESGMGAANRDMITDFEDAGATVADIINLQDIVADGGDAMFDWLGTGAFTNAAGQLRVDSDGGTGTLVQGDVTGDGIADFSIQVVAVLPGAFDAADFIL